MMIPLPDDGTDGTERVTAGENFHVFLFFQCIKGKLLELVNAKNPKMKITAQKGETPSKDYSEILKDYKNTGE